MVINDGDTVCVVGGGPGGSACAMVLLKEAQQLGKKIKVVLLEHKKFSENRHYNQCIGVLSPPFEDILKNELDLVLPDNLVLNEIEGYRLHSDLLSLDWWEKKQAGRFLLNAPSLMPLCSMRRKKQGLWLFKAA